MPKNNAFCKHQTSLHLHRGFVGNMKDSGKILFNFSRSSRSISLILAFGVFLYFFSILNRLLITINALEKLH